MIAGIDELSQTGSGCFRLTGACTLSFAEPPSLTSVIDDLPELHALEVLNARVAGTRRANSRRFIIL